MKKTQIFGRVIDLPIETGNLKKEGGTMFISRIYSDSRKKSLKERQSPPTVRGGTKKRKPNNGWGN